jgi:hypothetical protein
VYDFFTHAFLLLGSILGTIVFAGALLFLAYEFVTFVINFFQYIAQNNSSNPNNEENLS